MSLAISALFGQHAQAYQALSAQATIFHDQFVQALTSGGNLYAAAESHTVEQMVLNAINAPTQTLFGRPLIGDGANGDRGEPGRPKRRPQTLGDTMTQPPARACM